MSIDLEKIENAKGYLYVNDKRCPEPICVDDYIAYKEIEKELGISLITLFKAFKQGSIGSVYKFVQNDYNEEYKKGLVAPLLICGFFRKPNTNEYQLTLCDSLTCKNYIVDTKDYGKTWALTQSELTKE